jgi:hypothetical protein
MRTSAYESYTCEYRGGGRLSAEERRKALSPLLSRLEEYDALRRRLETEGGRLSDLSQMAKLLQTAVKTHGRYGMVSAAPSKPDAMKSLIREVDPDIHFQVRRLDTGMPVYYLCRVWRDYWSEYGLVVEDLYESPGYPLTDPRFVKLMYASHESPHLRLSDFRVETARLLGAEPESETVDDLLYEAGRHVLQSAWHEDQRLGFMIADRLVIPRFRRAVELLYLCLSGELCDLRGAANEQLSAFFQAVYPHPPIRDLLAMLPKTDGNALNDLPKTAAGLYKRLSRAFKAFMEREIRWGFGEGRMVPVWKVLYANISRPDAVFPLLADSVVVRDAAKTLDKAAAGVLTEILSKE